MAARDEQKVINGRTYYVVQMPPEKAFLIQLRLTKILGGAIGVMAPALAASNKMDNGSRAATMAGAIGALFANATEQEIFQLMAEVVTTAKVDGERIEINKHFQGEYLSDLYKVFFWVCGVNFESFFGAGGLDGLLSKFKTAMANELNSQPEQPPASTPSSGAQ